MQAAQTAAARGHDVVLYEMSDCLGGMLKVGCELSFKKDLKTYTEWMIARTEKSNVRIVLSTEVTASTVRREKPDVLVVAVGATPLMPPIPGIDLPSVVWAGDVDSGKVCVGQKVIVVGAGLTGVECAISLAGKGKEVTIIEMMGPSIVLGEAPSAHKYYLMDRIEEYGVRIETDTKVEEITQKGVRAAGRNFQRKEYEADSVVMATGLRPRKEKVEELRRLIPETEVFVVGDCVKPGSLFSANHQGFNAVCDL